MSVRVHVCLCTEFLFLNYILKKETIPHHSFYICYKKNIKKSVDLLANLFVKYLCIHVLNHLLYLDFLLSFYKSTDGTSLLETCFVQEVEPIEREIRNIVPLILD